MELNLKGKRAIIASSSRGLGLATAEGLAREGVNIAINGRYPEILEKLSREMSHHYAIECLALSGDISDPAVPAQLVEKAVAAWGGLDLLVTNSGGPPAGKFETFDDSDWQKAIDALFLSHVRMIRAALPYLRKSPAASVLTITSYSVKQPIPNLVLSNSIRLATIGLTKNFCIGIGFSRDSHEFDPPGMDCDRKDTGIRPISRSS